ncbi:glycosyltransferase family 2 protein [Paenibacillus nasutitermitis]|uniref:Glycosyl transferase family 2 n=1 Tax=Paenibacillus nasutitermitis TaxID=1652958 RepID=A0A916Z4S5_9BACL|nr:glycosyltransferase [Paenibacillus nasutitermitis]GGD76214.1 glycosyl transferase family 2 [Paenibacillus nasutitermitis]
MGNLVSVIMTTYNEELVWVKEALDSIMTQTYSNMEVIIVVDKPDEQGVIALLRQYEARYEQVKVLVNERNIGLALSLNKAFAVARGDYIARMDADDICEPERIELQVQLLEQNPNIHLVSSNCKYIDSDGVLTGEQKIGSKRPDKVKKGLMYTNFLIHPSWLMRREVFDKLGGYREFECSQDYDFLLRMISQNYHILLTEQKLVRYRLRDSSISSSRGFKQYLIAKYIRKLHDEREKSGTDSFSLESLEDYLSKNQLQLKNEKFTQSHHKFTDVRQAGSKLDKLTKASACLLYSKYSRDLLINSVFYKFAIRM